MSKSVKVLVGGKEYKLISSESEEYLKTLADHLDEKLSETTQSGFSTIDSLVLAGLTVTDEYYKSLDTIEGLRDQIKEYLEDVSKLKAELTDLRRELLNKK